MADASVASPGTTTIADRLRTVWRAMGSRDNLIAWGSLGVGFALWEVIARALDKSYLPPFSDVTVRLTHLINSGQIIDSLVRSLTNLAIGFTLAVVVGLTVGVLMARIQWLEDALDPFVYALLTAPTVVFVPIYFSLFGLSRWAIICLIWQYGVFMITVNTITAVKTIDVQLVEMASVYGVLNEWHLVRKIILPAALPLISAGVRLGMGRCVKGMINGEILIALVGLGGLSSRFARAFDAEGVFAMLVVVIVVAIIADGLVRLLDNRINHWLPSTHR